jgi:hypothetical protein
LLTQQKEARLREQNERSRLEDIESESRSWDVLQSVGDLRRRYREIEREIEADENCNLGEERVQVPPQVEEEEYEEDLFVNEAEGQSYSRQSKDQLEHLFYDEYEGIDRNQRQQPQERLWRQDRRAELGETAVTSAYSSII